MSGEVRFVVTPEGARDLVAAARQWSVSRIGYDAEFCFTGPAVPVRGGRVVRDATTIVPRLLSFTLAVRDGEGERLCRYVVDARAAGTAAELAPLFRLPVPFIGHSMLSDLHCLWKLSLPEPAVVWDTWVYEKAVRLGPEHRRYKVPGGATPGEEAAAREDTEAASAIANDLLSVCHRHGVRFPFRGDKAAMQQSFLVHPAEAPFSQQQIDYAAADAEAAARLYIPQIHRAARDALLHHLVAVEMPWVVTTARTTWHGVRRDPGACCRVMSDS